MVTKPIWVWLPGQATPLRAGVISSDGQGSSVTYTQDYVDSGVALDPIALRLGPRTVKVQGLPGVIEDAKPSGYGQDQLNNRHAARYGRDLSSLELMEEGAGDAVGAIAVCDDVERKQGWSAPPLAELVSALSSLEESAPASRAIRIVNNDVGTSAGGERPKITISDQGALWLAKMQDRGDRAGMPALEYTAMTLAKGSGINVPLVRLESVGENQVFLVQRFDRAGSVDVPNRALFASAHSVLRLAPSAVRGDPRRSYVYLAAEMRRWINVGAGSRDGASELWKRMVINALVGNIDDHARNHGLMYSNGGWGLSPAFDITPIKLSAGVDGSPYPSLALAVTVGGSCEATPENLLGSVAHFGVGVDDARHFILGASKYIADHWEGTLRTALTPLANQPLSDRVVSSARGAFAMAEHIAQVPDAVNTPADALMKRSTRARRQWCGK